MDILLVEDNPGDARLAQEAFSHSSAPVTLHIVSDGEDAMSFLRREGVHVHAPRPHLILLDLNLPKLSGRETLAQIKGDNRFKSIPTVILTTSDAVRTSAIAMKTTRIAMCESPRNGTHLATL